MNIQKVKNENVHAFKITCFRRHARDVHLGMCKIKMATPILMY